MRGRRDHSRHVESVTSPTKTSGIRRSVKVFTPRMRAANSSVMYRLIPSTIDTTAMRNITPIMTPRSVKKLLSFWTLICARASRTDSKKAKGAVKKGGLNQGGVEQGGKLAVLRQPAPCCVITGRVISEKKVRRSSGPHP